MTVKQHFFNKNTPFYEQRECECLSCTDLPNKLPICQYLSSKTHKTRQQAFKVLLLPRDKIYQNTAHIYTEVNILTFEAAAFNKMAPTVKWSLKRNHLLQNLGKPIGQNYPINN